MLVHRDPHFYLSLPTPQDDIYLIFSYTLYFKCTPKFYKGDLNE